MKNNKKLIKKIYLVLKFTDDDLGVPSIEDTSVVGAFENLNDAKKCFNKVIKEEGPAKEDVFDETKDELYYNCTNYSQDSFMAVKIVEIKLK